MLPFLKKNVDFFSLFNDAAANLIEVSSIATQLLSDPLKAATLAATLFELEHKGDAISRNAITLLHSTFITPLDREHIIGFVRLLDDVVDLIEAVGQRIDMYKIRELPPRMLELSKVNEQCASEVAHALKLLPSMKNASEILVVCANLHRLENEGDRILRLLLVDIFETINDTKRVIQLKELAEMLENVSDTCEDIANHMETIVLEYS
jgi:uncharacterized protein